MAETTIKVLMVDDDREDFLIIQQMLTMARGQFEVSWEANHSVAQGKLLEQDHDISLVDYRIGHHDGLELIKWAQSNDYDQPMIMLTGQGDHRLDELAMKTGAADYLPKDELSPMLIARTIRHAIDRKEMQKELAYLAKHDPLTGLVNRTLFGEYLNRALSKARRHNREFAILFLDLDKFKDINDSYGHLVGDQLLKAIAARLMSFFRQEDVICRFGGDEFVLLIDDADTEKVSVIASKIMRKMKEPIVIENQNIEISFSMGAAIYPRDGTNPEDLIKLADKALYRAKNSGRNNFQIYH